MNYSLPKTIEAILFATGEPQSFTDLARILSVDSSEISLAIDELLKQYDESRGITLLSLNETVSLVTKPELSDVLEAIRKEELTKELTKASAETLAIIAYEPGISKAQIEFIRGVTVSYSIRSLMMRGLIESKGQGRAVGYYPTLDLLRHFGITTLTELPQYETTKAKLDALLQGESDTATV